MRIFTMEAMVNRAFLLFQIKIEDSDKIVQVQSSRESSYYLFESGEVLACGRNNEGQLGNNSEDRLNTNSDEPIVKVELEDEVRSITT